MRFTDKICLVTGGGSGIGRAACQRLAHEGGTVVVIDRDAKSAGDTVDLIVKSGGKAVAQQVDIGVPSQIEQCLQTVITKYGRVDILVNDAAMMTFQKIIDLSIDEWDKVPGVNFCAVCFCKYNLPHMTNGSIVNISSAHAHQTEPTVYTASKGGIEALQEA